MPETETKFSSNFVINKNKNLTSNYDREPEIDQVPFFLNSIGPPTIKKRVEPYKNET